MRIRLCVVGRMRQGPEAILFRDYLERFNRLARGQGIGPAEFVEVETGKHPDPEREAQGLRRIVPGFTHSIAMDERGRMMTSPEFAELLSRWNHEGCDQASILIGGVEGLHPDLRRNAGVAVSMGRMVWPHLLARVMVMEQLYRAASILAGSAYHRGQPDTGRRRLGKPA